MIGDGPLKDELQRQAKRLGVSDNCIFTGARTDVPEILSSLDILILPSLSEGFPIILLEAMASSCPIVASEVGGVKELIENGKTGLLVPSADSQALAEAIRELLQNKEKAQSMGSFAQRIVRESFSLNRMIAQTEDTYEQLISAAQQRGRRVQGME